MGLLKRDPYTTKERGGQTRKGRTRCPDGVKPTFYALLDPESVKSRFDPFFDSFFSFSLFLFDPLLDA
jgi:hypothetical protein